MEQEPSLGKAQKFLWNNLFEATLYRPVALNSNKGSLNSLKWDMLRVYQSLAGGMLQNVIHSSVL